MSLNPSSVQTGHQVSVSIMGDTYDDVIEATSATGKTLTLEGGRKARWNQRRQRYQIGASDSRGYAMVVINRVPAKWDPHV